MFNLSYTAPYEEEVKTIMFPSKDGKENNPMWKGLGNYTDINGVVWNIHGVFGSAYSPTGKSFVWARIVDSHPLYSTTSHLSLGASTQGTTQLQGGWYSDSMWSATWNPYYVELVESAERRGEDGQNLDEKKTKAIDGESE